MTAPHLKTADKIAVMQAFAEGKRIQFKRNVDDDTHWVDQPDPWWAWQLYDYRVAPEPAATREAREWSIAVRPSGDVDDWFPVLGNDENWWRKNGHEIVRVREVLPDPVEAVDVAKPSTGDAGLNYLIRMVQAYAEHVDGSGDEISAKQIRSNLRRYYGNYMDGDLEPPSGKLPEWRWFKFDDCEALYRTRADGHSGGGCYSVDEWSEVDWYDLSFFVGVEGCVETDAHGTPLGREGV